MCVRFVFSSFSCNPSLSSRSHVAAIVCVISWRVAPLWLAPCRQLPPVMTPGNERSDAVHGRCAGSHFPLTAAGRVPGPCRRNRRAAPRNAAVRTHQTAITNTQGTGDIWNGTDRSRMLFDEMTSEMMQLMDWSANSVAILKRDEDHRVFLR